MLRVVVSGIMMCLLLVRWILWVGLVSICLVKLLVMILMFGIYLCMKLLGRKLFLWCC